jgi:hypothetical protein
MDQPKKHQPVKLITGFIFQEEGAFDRAKLILEKRFARIDFQSEALPFVHTTYYEKEFGKALKRRFISFNKLISPADLPKIKTYTNSIEKKLSVGRSRSVNIDPGYLDLAKLVLASTKDYKHRVYLNQGIYSEVTLFYEDQSYKPWEWTYPDYKSGEYIAIFNRIRDIYAGQIKNLKQSQREGL